jgi:hypothetical protein
MEHKDTLHVAVAIEADDDGNHPAGDVVAYAFSGGGHLLSSSPLDEAGAARLSVARGKEPSEARIIVGPRLEKPGLTELIRRGATETHVRLDPKKLAPVDIAIGADEWLCWYQRPYVARGTVLKRTLHDGEPLDLPVCGAEVEVYEVDPVWLIVPRLPDTVLEQIRDKVLVRPPRHIRLPDPDPSPLVVSSAHVHAQVQADTAGPGDLEPEVREMAGVFASPAAAPLMHAALSGNLDRLREQLLLNPDITRHVLCLLPRWVTMTLVATTTTNSCGHFRATFARGCKNHDEPDLYFRVFQPRFFLRAPIYDPAPVACYTYWDHPSATDVTLFTSSPLARTCMPCRALDPGSHDNYVAVMNVGNLLTSNIQGVTSPAAPGERGLTLDRRPFGGTLNPHLEFDPRLRDSLGVMYYRVTVQKPGVGTLRELDAHCYRRYTYYVPSDMPGVPGSVIGAPYTLGPKTVTRDTGVVAHLFEIPPGVAPHNGTWSTTTAYETLANAKWDSTVEAPGVAASASADHAGVFELKIELFDASGAPIDVVARHISWLVPRETSLTGADVLHLEPPAPGVVQGNAFVLALHVDNNPCEARIGVPTLNGSADADDCGVIRYEPSQSNAERVQMPYTATHRNGFATHSFTVKRGTNVLTPPTTPGEVGVAPGTFTPDEKVLDMLSRMPAPQPPMSPPCTIGAFLEELGVHTMATDGWSRLSGYDAGDSRAFTLAPEKG